MSRQFEVDVLPWFEGLAKASLTTSGNGVEPRLANCRNVAESSIDDLFAHHKSPAWATDTARPVALPFLTGTGTRIFEKVSKSLSDCFHPNAGNVTPIIRKQCHTSYHM